ncbi:MAG: hypothetical protein ACRDJY_07625 [Thermoleophilaceae bacterium]
MNSHFKISAVIAALALLVPAGAAAKRPDDKPAKGNKHGKAHRQGKPKTLKTKLVTANVKGLVEANDGTNMTVHVVKASGQARACKGSSLTFDVSDARFHTADNNDDGEMNADDVLVEHIVKVRSKVVLSKGRKTTCSPAEAEVLMAKAVHNRTTPQVDEDEFLEDEDEFFDEDEFLDEDEDFFDDEEFFDDQDELEDDEDELLEDDEFIEDDEFLDDEELDDF